MNWEFVTEFQLFLMAQRIETESDYFNFRLVCKKWRDFLPELRRPILLGQMGSQGEFTFNGLSSQLPLRLGTRLFSNMESYLHFCCGASFTWLILRNPVTCCISACKPFLVGQFISLGCLFSPPEFGANFVVNKVIFSHPPSEANCTAVAICCEWKRVAVWTQGSSWVWCPNLINGWFADLTFWHGNLYLVDTLRNIYQCHYTRPTNPSITVIPNRDKGGQVSLVQYDHFYLIGSIPNMLLLLSVCTTGDVDFELYRVDISSTVFLCPQDTMPDFGVFLGKNQDFAIPSRFLPGGLGTVFLVDYLDENSPKIFSLRLPYHTSRLTCPDAPMEWKACLWLLPCVNFADLRVLTQSRGILDSTNDEDYEDEESRKKKRKIEKEVAAESAGQDGATHEVLTSESLMATVQNFCGEFHLGAEKASQNHDGRIEYCISSPDANTRQAAWTTTKLSDPTSRSQRQTRGPTTTSSNHRTRTAVPSTSDGRDFHPSRMPMHGRPPPDVRRVDHYRSNSSYDDCGHIPFIKQPLDTEHVSHHLHQSMRKPEEVSIPFHSLPELTQPESSRNPNDTVIWKLPPSPLPCIPFQRIPAGVQRPIYPQLPAYKSPPTSSSQKIYPKLFLEARELPQLLGARRRRRREAAAGIIF